MLKVVKTTTIFPPNSSTFAPDFQNKAGASHNLLTRDDESYMDSIVHQSNHKKEMHTALQIVRLRTTTAKRKETKEKRKNVQKGVTYCAYE